MLRTPCKITSDTYFAVSQEVYQKVSESSPELSAQLTSLGESSLEFTHDSEGRYWRLLAV